MEWTIVWCKIILLSKCASGISMSAPWLHSYSCARKLINGLVGRELTYIAQKETWHVLTRLGDCACGWQFERPQASRQLDSRPCVSRQIVLIARGEFPEKFQKWKNMPAFVASDLLADACVAFVVIGYRTPNIAINSAELEKINGETMPRSGSSKTMASHVVWICTRQHEHYLLWRKTMPKI